MKNKIESIVLRNIVKFAGIVTFLILIFIIFYILFKGIPYLRFDMFALNYNSNNVSMFPAIINTIVLVLLTLLFSVPIGIFTAIYLVEYSSKKSNYVKIIRITAQTLSAIPSIVYGLFGFLFFVINLKMSYSILSGSITLAIMILPIIIRTTEEALLSVPDFYREASYGLGATKSRTIFKIVLPCAKVSIISGIILSIGRIVGETAALIYTAGTVSGVIKSITDSGRTLSVHMYALLSEGLHMNEAYATAVILLIVVLFINIISLKIVNNFKE